MKLFANVLRWVGAITVVLAVILFAVATREIVTITLDPFPFTFDTRVTWVAFGTLVVGFLGGAVAAWVGAGRWRRLARSRQRELDVLEREVARLSERREDDRDGTERLPSAAG